MENRKCLEKAQIGSPFQMNGQVIFPAEAMKKIRERGMMCPAVYGIMKKDECLGCEIVEKCYIFQGGIIELDSDVKYFMSKGELISHTKTIGKDVPYEY